MWQRAELKRRARQTLRRNYWTMVAVCFVMAFFIGEYGTSLGALYAYDDTVKTASGQGLLYRRMSAQTLRDFWAGLTGSSGTWSDSPVLQAAANSLNALLSNVQDVLRFLQAFNAFAFEHDVLRGALLLAGAAGMICYVVFVKNILIVGERRFILDARLDDAAVNRIFFLYGERAVKNPARVMLLRSVRQFLWSLTVVGGFVKVYEYRMIPYLLAEQPDLSAKEAFRLSRTLMQGNKWRAFVLDCSFLPWYLLQAVSFGMLGIFFLNPYRLAAEAELYVAVKYEGFEKEHPVHRVHFERLDCNVTYHLSDYVLLFFSFSFLGWLWEVAVQLFQKGVLVKRGVLLGPWLPIYGCGGVLILFLLRRVRARPVATFLYSMLVCSVLEYFTSWMLEKLYDRRWWDYSGYLLNINGRICLLSVVVFGLGGCGFVYLLGPALYKLYAHVPYTARSALCAALLTLFGADAVHAWNHPNTGFGITEEPAVSAQSSADSAAAP